VLTEGNGYYTSNLGLPACQKLSELQQERGDVFKAVAFAPSGGWSVLWNQNGYWTIGDAPDAAFKKLGEVANSGGTLRSVAYGPNGDWVVLFDKTGVWYGGVPADLRKTLDNAIDNKLTIRCVSFTSLGTWICLTNNGWWTNNLDHPACKMIAELDKQHKPLHWVAVAPETGPHDFKKWAAYLHEKCDGKLPGGYAFIVMHEGKIVARGAEGWARTPWQTEHPSVKWTLDKPMGVASVSKTVTAVGLLKLWEDTGEKKFSLDDSFWQHIKGICPQASDGAKTVTIRQLLRHRSGFNPVDDCKTPNDLEKLLSQKLRYPAGTHYAYDNNNFYAARLVLEQIGHVQYSPYIKQHVLAPMGITDMETHFQASDPTCGYGKPGSKRPGYPFDWNCDATSGAAGWYASINDLGRFLTGLRNHVVLTPATTDTMYKQLLGWDTADPGYEKNGGWSWDEGSAPHSRAGSLYSSIYHFRDDVDAAMLINSDAPISPQALLGQAWHTSMQK
jgi:CubicO group peptidase (beta-lactamase class C family)